MKAKSNGHTPVNRVAKFFTAKKTRVQTRKKRPQQAMVAIEAVKLAKQLIGQCGGTEAARTLIDILG